MTTATAKTITAMNDAERGIALKHIAKKLADIDPAIGITATWNVWHAIECLLRDADPNPANDLADALMALPKIEAHILQRVAIAATRIDPQYRSPTTRVWSALYDDLVDIDLRDDEDERG